MHRMLMRVAVAVTDFVPYQLMVAMLCGSTVLRGGDVAGSVMHQGHAPYSLRFRIAAGRVCGAVNDTRVTFRVQIILVQEFRPWRDTRVGAS